jgi:hypothetical protein
MPSSSSRHPPPIRRQTVSHFLQQEIGREWHLTPYGRAKAIRLINPLKIVDEKNRPIPWTELTFRCARDLHVDRRATVVDFWAQKNSPILQPHLPCLLVERGTRGTSKDSRRFQLSGGHPWAPNEPHVDYHPLEKVYVGENDPDEFDGFPAEF